jgi:hypothetical protein
MRPPQDEVIALSSDDLHIPVLPGKGAGIYAITDCATGIDVPFKTPWGWRQPDRPQAGDSQQQWLARSLGGWQQLMPNAGPEVFAVNVKGAFVATRACLPYLRRAPGGGAIVVVSSVQATATQTDVVAYTASKNARETAR